MIGTFIRISIYQYNMTKVKITISLDEDVAKQLRTESIAKYGNARSLSTYIEDLAKGAVKPAPQLCRLGVMSKWAITKQEEFDKAVENVSQQIKAIKIPEATKPEQYFILKEVLEQRLNHLADSVNGCPSCHGLDEPLPTYPDAGRNFEELYLVSNQHR